MMECKKCVAVRNFNRGFYGMCRKCTEAQIGVGNRKCRVCRNVSHSENFHGLVCMLCYSKKTAKYAKANPEQSRASAKQNYLKIRNDPEKYAQYLARRRELWTIKQEKKNAEGDT